MNRIIQYSPDSSRIEFKISSYVLNLFSNSSLRAFISFETSGTLSKHQNIIEIIEFKYKLYSLNENNFCVA